MIPLGPCQQAPSIVEKFSHREGSPALSCDDEDGDDGEDDGDGDGEDGEDDGDDHEDGEDDGEDSDDGDMMMVMVMKMVR